MLLVPEGEVCVRVDHPARDNLAHLVGDSRVYDWSVVSTLVSGVICVGGGLGGWPPLPWAPRRRCLSDPAFARYNRPVWTCEAMPT